MIENNRIDLRYIRTWKKIETHTRISDYTCDTKTYVGIHRRYDVGCLVFSDNEQNFSHRVYGWRWQFERPAFPIHPTNVCTSIAQSIAQASLKIRPLKDRRTSIGSSFGSDVEMRNTKFWNKTYSLVSDSPLTKYSESVLLFSIGAPIGYVSWVNISSKGRSRGLRRETCFEYRINSKLWSFLVNVPPILNILRVNSSCFFFLIF